MQIRVGATRLAEPQRLLAEDEFVLRFFRRLLGIAAGALAPPVDCDFASLSGLFLEKRRQVETRRRQLGFDVPLVIPGHRSPAGKLGFAQARLDVLQLELFAAFDVIAAHGERNVRQALAQPHEFLGAELESDVGVTVTDRADRAVRFHFGTCQPGVETDELDFFLGGRDAAARREGLGRHVADMEDLREPGRVSDGKFELHVRTGQTERLERPIRLGG